MLEQIFSIAGSISGILSLAGIIYLVGYWKGGVDNKLKGLCTSLDKYPPGEIALMCKTMWDIYVVDALRAHPELAQHNSPLKLTPQGMDLIPEHIRLSLANIPSNPTNREDIASGWLVVKHLGLSAIEELAKETCLTLQETIAVLSTYLDDNGNNRMSH